MKRKSIAVAMIATFSAITGCNSSSATSGSNHHQAPAPAAPAPAQVSGPAWTVSLASNCSAGENACVGQYGFSIDADGTYTVGPAPTGQKYAGKVSAAQLSELNDALNKLSSGSATLSDGAAAQEFDLQAPVDGQSKITLRKGSQSVTLVSVDAQQFSYRGSSDEAALALYSAVMGDANQFYPIPFPNACADAANSLMQLYPTVQGCTTDADCTYVNPSFEAIDTEGHMGAQDVVTDDCSIAAPLAVANRVALNTQGKALSDKLNEVKNTCGTAGISFTRASCTQTTSFAVVNAPAPQCGADRMCHINSAAFTPAPAAAAPTAPAPQAPAAPSAR